jgi:hypothetical protein
MSKGRKQKFRLPAITSEQMFAAAQAQPFMRKIKFSGRELSVLRAIDFATGSMAEELLHRTRMDAQDVADILNAFLVSGFIETSPPREQVVPSELATLKVEINPGYSHQLSQAIRARW